MNPLGRLDKLLARTVQAQLNLADNEAFVRSPYRRGTRHNSSPPSPLSPHLSFKTASRRMSEEQAALRIQRFVRVCQAKEETLQRLEARHTATLLARCGKSVRGHELAWVSVLQYPKSEEWVVRLEEAQGAWRLEAKVGPHHAWRLYDLPSILEGVDLTAEDQLVLNAQEKKSCVVSALPTETPTALFCKRLIRLAGRTFWLTAKVERNILTLALEGSIRDKFKPLSLTTAFTEYSLELLEEEVERLLPRLTLHNQALVLGSARDKTQVSLKLTNRATVTDFQILAAGRRRIAGRWYAVTVTLRQQERLNTMLAVYELEARADQPDDICLTREYQLSEILGKLNLWTAGELVSLGEELLDHVQLDGKAVDFTREKSGAAATKQELLRVTKTLSNKFDYELVFLYDIALPSSLTIEAKALENSPPIDHALDLDLVAIREQAQLNSAQLTNEDLGKLVDMVDLQDGELALLQPSSAAPLPTVHLHEDGPRDSSISAIDASKSAIKEASVELTEVQMRGIMRLQAFFRMKLARRSWGPIKNPSQNLVLRRCKTVRGQSYVISATRSSGGLHLEALRLADSRLLTKEISNPADYAFGYSKLEDLQLLVDSLTETRGKLGLRKGKRRGKSGSSINISELDISFFRDLEEERDTAARMIVRFFRSNMFRKRFRRLIDISSRKLLMCKRKDIGNGLSLISIFQEDTELTVEICEPVKEPGKLWKVQRMKLDLASLGDSQAPLELLLQNLKMVNGTLQPASLAELSPLLVSGEEEKERRRQLLTRVRTFDGRKTVVSVVLVQPLPLHADPRPTDMLEFELVPPLSDPPSKATITLEEAASRLGLPTTDLIPIANLTISKLLRVRGTDLELASDLPSPIIKLQEVANSIQATARGFLVRSKYRASLRQLKSYLVAMAEMQFFQQPFVVYAYHLEDKYKIEAVHRLNKVTIMLMIDEGLIRRFKFGDTRKKVFEEAVFPRLFMVEEGGLLRLCLNHRMGSERPSTRSLRSTLTDFEVTIEPKRWETPTEEDSKPEPLAPKLSETTEVVIPKLEIPHQRSSLVPRLQILPPQVPVQPTTLPEPAKAPPITVFQPGPPLFSPPLREHIYHLDVVVKKHTVPDQSRGNSLPSDEIRRIRRLQASIKRPEMSTSLTTFSHLPESRSVAQLSRPPLKPAAPSQLFVKTYVPALRSHNTRSASSLKPAKLKAPSAPRKELIFKTGHHISDYFCVVSFFRMKRSCMLIEAVDPASHQKYTCKVTIDPSLSGPDLDSHCEELLQTLEVVRGKEGWQLGVKTEEDRDFFVV